MRKIAVLLCIVFCTALLVKATEIQQLEELEQEKQQASLDYIEVVQNIGEKEEEIELLTQELESIKQVEILDKYDLLSKIQLMEYILQNRIFLENLENLIEQNQEDLSILQAEKSEILNFFGEISIDLDYLQEIFQEDFSPIWPVPNYDETWVTNEFGGDHYGYDIAANYGEDVVSVQSGTVISVSEHWSWGINVLIYHNEDYTTRYAHLSSALVEVGDIVETGQIIGRIGSTGNSTGNHLHYEVYYQGTRVDPYPFF